MTQLTKLSDAVMIKDRAIPIVGVIVDEAPAVLTTEALKLGYRHVICTPANLAAVRAAIAAGEFANAQVAVSIRLVPPVAPLSALASNPVSLLVAEGATAADQAVLAQAVASGLAGAWGTDGLPESAAQPAEGLVVLPLGVTAQLPAVVHAARAAGLFVASDLPFGEGDLTLLRPLRRMADRLGKTPAQIVVRWLLQQGVLVWLPASTSAQLAEWGAVFDFELSFQDQQVLAALDGRAMAPQKHRRR